MCIPARRLNALRLIVLPGLLVLLLGLLAGCSRAEFPALPGIPEDLRPLRGLLDSLELPDLSGMTLPGLDSLPALDAPEGALLLRGPTAWTLMPGERLAASDVVYEGKQGDVALFTIDGLRSERRIGDSIDFDGAWPGLPDSRHQLRLRVYSTIGDAVRLAGVQQLLIPDLAPVEGMPPQGGVELRLPFTDGVTADGRDTITGTTLGYLGRYERGAQLSGVAPNAYPYRTLGDSIVWQGTLRPDVGARYDLRMLTYGNSSMRVGGVVTVTLP